ncbi:hypothetical protein [Paenibacillus lutimineralis]|uniref:Uncharacterized protein n=1 Tax=Paenibacillus lutimineralis TaxID=2707005 RepID=A0A3Q9IA54_9BACL|nr:hypothetical protein [Paenibacillus lutimineralis]AZS16000.1 hypothetical protein EI981_17215 [Paenibacillus lutimineralis]
MAKIKPMLGIHLDLEKPVDEIVHVINAVLKNHPFRKILRELDLRIGEAIAAQARQNSPNEGSEDADNEVAEVVNRAAV